MTRLAVAAVALLGLVTVAAQEASALSARNRVCVQAARKRARDGIRTSRLAFLDQQRKDLVACFGPAGSPTNVCAGKCQDTQSACVDNNVTTPRTLCDTSSNPDDQVTSCTERFNADVTACRDKKLPDGTPDFDAQLACQADARAARFVCSQGCALQVQDDLDTCGVNFSDCLEFCG